MIYANKSDGKITIAAKGNRTDILKEFAFLAKKLVEQEKQHGEDGNIYRELVDAALMTGEEIGKEIVKTEKEIMEKMSGTEEEKKRMMEAMLALME